MTRLTLTLRIQRGSTAIHRSASVDLRTPTPAEWAAIEAWITEARAALEEAKHAGVVGKGQLVLKGGHNHGE